MPDTITAGLAVGQPLKLPLFIVTTAFVLALTALFLIELVEMVPPLTINVAAEPTTTPPSL